jgi:tRNA/tmRNA/rRNA uracil-C5-methylase (TrmA/RlmC/RlmD family)
VSFGTAGEWRCRARLAVRVDENGALTVGLFRRGTHQVVEIPRCVVHHPRINQAVRLITAVGWKPTSMPPD